ncbi:adenylate/guanylate cyclase with Chase sensor [Pseudodesulfovibrio mercurii]|uniref:Adenylate/guanylate cyclase with Chase sensor n=1 Tax=Pseudodesulfovibrio mercurii TaxID=641491 RepID=F0JCZ2_9BACT|nr:adenylate/guanylate cyclase domain-containing protein [Pseudodesulfovibrio mercurii]EGB14484.1 adenylate/guanylate cyclase with Chase sensor [Pseudodesulfovibrio mercurii]
MSRRLRKVLAGLLFGLIGAALALDAQVTGLLDAPENLTRDLRVRALAHPGAATDRIRLVLLDQKSLDWAKSSFGLGWPWPRQAYAPMVEFCRRAGAASLSMDVIFTEPSVYGVADDQALAGALRSMGRAVLAASFARSDGSSRTWPAHVPAPSFTVGGEAVLRRAEVATFPIPDLTGGTLSVGNVNVPPDADNVYRRLPLLVRFAGGYAPSLPLAAFLADRPEPVTLAPDEMRVGATRIPLTPEGDALLNYRGRNAYTAYGAAALMESGMRLAEGGEPVIDPADLKGRHVLFGFSATGLLDLRPTPMGGVSPGVLINATALDNLLSGDFLRPAPAWTDAATTLLFAVLGGLGVALLTSLWAAVAASAGTLALPVAYGAILYAQGVRTGMAVQLTGCLVALFLAGTWKYATEGRRKQFIKSAFRQYLSPKVIDQLLQHPERLTLGGERRELTIFFSDLQGFTSISEGLDPEALTGVLNDYLSAMTDIIHHHQGTVDKYEGDAIIAFWNAPLDQPDHALLAVRAALACQAKLAEMRPALRERTHADVFMRIGLNTGPAVVGNLGSRERFDYTMLGDAVNLASRLESINKRFGTYTMVSQATLDRLGGEIPARELSRLRVVGKREAVTVFEPLSGEEHRARQADLAVFAEGLALFRAGDFRAAAVTFAAIAPRDPAAGKYAVKCAELAADPPEQWDGVWTMTGK